MADEPDATWPPTLSKPRDAFGPGVIYVVQSTDQTAVKIGYSSTAAGVRPRLAMLQTGNPYLLRVLATTAGLFADERIAHAAFAAERLTGEWFEFSPRVRVFVEAISAGRSVKDAVDMAASIAEPPRAEWSTSVVSEPNAVRLFDVPQTSIILSARMRDEGPPVYASGVVRGRGKPSRYYLVSAVKEWLVARAIPHRFTPNLLHLAIPLASFEAERG